MNKNGDGHYWIKLHFKDWHNSQALMLCSMQARGVALEAEIIMRQSPIPGMMLLADGSPITPAMLARMALASTDEIESGLAELVERGEFELVEGTYYCHRLALQQSNSRYFSELGKRGADKRLATRLSDTHKRHAQAKASTRSGYGSVSSSEERKTVEGSATGGEQP